MMQNANDDSYGQSNSSSFGYVTSSNKLSSFDQFNEVY